MSLKFNKNKSVTFTYANLPMFYTGIINSKNSSKELVVIDDFKYHFIVCWRNTKTNKCGLTFKVRFNHFQR